MQHTFLQLKQQKITSTLLKIKMNNIETEFGFDEYIMPTTYSTIPKVESYDAQLYPSGTYTIYIYITSEEKPFEIDQMT